MKNVTRQLRDLKNKNPWFQLLWHETVRARFKSDVRRYSDLQAVNRAYYSLAHRFPNLQSPVLFSEKLQWLKLRHRDLLMCECADKHEVRKYVERSGYSGILNDIIGVYQKVEDIDFQKLPGKFVLKATHGCGYNIICKDNGTMNWAPWKLVLRSWLRHNIYANGREWIYKNIAPRLVCERYLEDSNGYLLDYKFYCFNGSPKFVQVNKGRFERKHVQNFYDLNWSLLPFGKEISPSPDAHIPKPESLEEMISIAKDLSAPFCYVRVDLYEVDGKVVFGELTFFPHSGLPDFVPPEYDRIVGEMLALPKA